MVLSACLLLCTEKAPHAYVMRYRCTQLTFLAKNGSLNLASTGKVYVSSHCSSGRSIPVPLYGYCQRGGAGSTCVIKHRASRVKGQGSGVTRYGQGILPLSAIVYTIQQMKKSCRHPYVGISLSTNRTNHGKFPDEEVRSIS